MPPLPVCPDGLLRPAAASITTSSIVKPPLPSCPTRLSTSVKNIEVQLPPLIAGAVVASFAKALADGLANELLTHYYLPEQKVRLNLDRVLDRLLSEFTSQLWDELFSFYHENNEAHSKQVTLLFEGPVRQIVLILNGPETARCILDQLGPGLSQRPVTWSENARGIELPLALQLLCSFWHREFPELSPGGTPDEIGRSLHGLIVNGNASKRLISEMRRLLFSPHYVQMHMGESAIWDMILKQRRRPPADGFHVVQFKFECDLFGPLDGIGDPQLVSIGSLPAITGTADDCVHTTVSEYITTQWPKCGRILLTCLQEAVGNASASASTASPNGDLSSGMSVWDASGSDESALCPGLRLIHVEVEGAAVRLSVSGWTHTLIEVFQQMCWICAALSASPFPGALSECAVDVADWTYLDDSIYVDCNIAHARVVEGESMAWLGDMKGAAIAKGFPVVGVAFDEML